MKTTFKFLLLSALALVFVRCDPFWGQGVYKELSRDYSPDSTHYILKYHYDLGALDNGAYMVTVLPVSRTNSTDTSSYYLSYYIDTLYWKNNNTVIVAENYADYSRSGKKRYRSIKHNGVDIKIVYSDPIDSTYTRKIYCRETSPNGLYELVVYKYVQRKFDDYYLNISIINVGDSIPKYGNYFISEYGSGCLTDVRWNSNNELALKASSSYYSLLENYLAKNRPKIKYVAKIDDRQDGNITPY